MYLLDSSAWLAHLFGEVGMIKVNNLFALPRTDVCISVLSIPEVFNHLKAIDKEREWPRVWTTDAALFTRVIFVDEQIAYEPS